MWPTFPLGSSPLLHNHGGYLTWWLDSFVFNNPNNSLHLLTIAMGPFFIWYITKVETQHQLQMVFIHNTYFSVLPTYICDQFVHMMNY
jgi:hypothetical protein